MTLIPLAPEVFITHITYWTREGLGLAFFYCFARGLAARPPDGAELLLIDRGEELGSGHYTKGKAKDHLVNHQPSKEKKLLT